MKEDFTNQKEIDKDFDIYESGIIRLKDLEDRLNHLNTESFWNLEKKIRSKLKSVGGIPKIEEEMDLLEKKILIKRGKKGLYKKVWKPLKKKTKVKKEVIVGDVPEPVEIKDSPIRKEKPLISKIFGGPKENKQKNYEREIKGAIGHSKKQPPLVIDSVSSQKIKKQELLLKQEKAKIELERKNLEKNKQLMEGSYKKYHPVKISVGDYSVDSKKATEAILRLKKLHEKKGFF